MENLPVPESNPEQKFSQIIDLGLERHKLITAESQAAMSRLEGTMPDHEAVKYTASTSPEHGHYNLLSSITFDQTPDTGISAKVKILGNEYVSDITGWHRTDEPGKYFSHDHVINLLNDSFGLPHEILDSPVNDLSYLEPAKRSIEASTPPDLRIKTYQATQIKMSDWISIDEVNYRLQSVQTKDGHLAYIVEVSAPHYVDSNKPASEDAFIEKTVQYVATGEHVGKARVILSGTSPHLSVIEEYTKSLSKEDRFDYYHPDDLHSTFSSVINSVLEDKQNHPDLGQL